MQVNFHRAHFDSEPYRNSLIRKSLRDELSYFQLPFSQSWTAESVSGPLIFLIKKHFTHPSCRSVPGLVCALLAISVYQLLPNHGCSTSLSKSIQASHVKAIKKYLLQQTHGRCASPHLGARPPVPTEMGK
jgi:hypothetical protein